MLRETLEAMDFRADENNERIRELRTSPTQHVFRHSDGLFGARPSRHPVVQSTTAQIARERSDAVRNDFRRFVDVTGQVLAAIDARKGVFKLYSEETSTSALEHAVAELYRRANDSKAPSLSPEPFMD